MKQEHQELCAAITAEALKPEATSRAEGLADLCGLQAQVDAKIFNSMPVGAREAFDRAAANRKQALGRLRTLEQAENNPALAGISAKEVSEELEYVVEHARKIHASIDAYETAGDDAMAAEMRQTFDALMADDGEVTKLRKLDAQTADRDKRRKALAAAKTQHEPLFPFGARIETMSTFDSIRHIAPQLNFFKNHDQAIGGIMQVRAIVGRGTNNIDRQAEEYLGGHGIMATQTEGSPTGGGYTVPDPLSSAYIEYRQKIVPSRQLSTVLKMTADTLSVPKVSAGFTVYGPGEAGAITASTETFAQLSLSATKRAILGYVSNELRDDAAISIMDQAMSRMAFEFAKAEDAEWILGDGTSTYRGETGVLTAIGSAGVSTAATGHDTWLELDVPDAMAWFAKLPGTHNGPGKSIVCSPAFYYTVLLRLQATAGGNNISSLQDGDGGRPMFLGVPCFFSDNMQATTAAATVCALYGNFSEACLIGDRIALDLAISEQYAFNQDLVALRGTTRYDILWHNVGDSSTAGAVVAWKTAS